MEVKEKVTPTAVRLVVTTSKNVIYVANLNHEQLEETINRYGLVFRRPRGSRANLEQIESEEKEDQNASSSQAAPE